MAENISDRKLAHIEDGASDNTSHLLRHRLPWLVLGLFGGVATSIIVSKYESILS